jgi:segregation and condensation protein A
MLQEQRDPLESALNQKLYVVHLPVFEGPLDLLLHLIEKHQMEITTVSLMTVTDQYLAYLQHWQDEHLPLANMAAFVSIAARLLYIKSQSLLPQQAREESGDAESPGKTLVEELRLHVLEYKLVKEIALVLRQREEAGLQTHSRSGLLAGIEAQLAWTPPTLVKTDTDTLARAFHRLLTLQAKDAKNGNQLMPIARVRVSERISEIMAHLQEKPEVSLTEIIAQERSRLVIVVTFLAILELWKWERIDVKQEALMAPIQLERGSRWSLEGEEEWQSEE